MFVEDLAAFFNPDTPGVFVATINGATVNGALEREMEESLENATREYAPMFSCDKSDLPVVAIGDVVTVDGRNYHIRDISMDDYDPIAVLHLNNP